MRARCLTKRLPVTVPGLVASGDQDSQVMPWNILAPKENLYTTLQGDAISTSMHTSYLSATTLPAVILVSTNELFLRTELLTHSPVLSSSESSARDSDTLLRKSQIKHPLVPTNRRDHPSGHLQIAPLLRGSLRPED